MNESLRLTALFIRDLLVYNEQLIKIGRLGAESANFKENYIGVDELGQAQRLASGQKFNDVTESMTYAQQWRSSVTLTFYGANAWANAAKVSALIPSQLSLELQEALGISIYQASGLTDVRLITGQQQGNRLELTLNIQYNISAAVDTLRIDTAQIELITD